jgi:hypothetical protein
LTLGDSLQSLVSWDGLLACDHLQEADKSDFNESLDATLSYAEAMEDLDFSAVPNAPLTPLSQAEDRLPRLVIKASEKSVCLDGVPYSVTEEEAAFLECLLKAKGNFVSSTQMKKDEPRLADVRVSRAVRQPLKRYKPISDLIESDTGKGFKLKSEVWPS